MPGPGERIVVFGDVIDDILVRPHGPIRADTDTPAAIRQRPGGSAANVAAWLGSLGAPVDFVGIVGAGDVSSHAAALEAQGVRAHLLADPELPTGTIIVLIDENNTRTMLTERGANVRLTPDCVDDALLAGAGGVHFTGYSVFSCGGAADEEGFRRLLERAHASGAVVSVDPSSAGFLADFGVERFLTTIRGADILLPNLDEGMVLTGLEEPTSVAARLSEWFPVVALTLGAAGTIVAVAGTEPVCLPVEAALRTDSTGAGDAFSAGFLAAWLSDSGAATPLQRAVTAARAGGAAAANAIELVGGRPD
ncbi:carbohydrate kinase family protein [Microterricola viridarii]|uniref:Carbohydrate kinase PfkB domain-containing protein n=1 Tax=Microterricola viridarii TaxID=412690 RepID=A0A0Y0ML78_9MICO|nr:PfkB family carbohydrate kinase [Microterricola viridarii]AMB57804.1 hypothetical protein AWU67_01785 [Microterricola viridarii]